MKDFFSLLIPTKRLQLPLLVFSVLVFTSFGFFSIASENFSGKNIFQDADQDGLTNEEEHLYGTDPQKADTDGDSYSDGAEVRSGYDPLKPSPGDKIVPTTKETAQASQTTASSTTSVPEEPSGTGGSSEDNLTEQVSQQIADILKDSSGNTNATDTSATIQTMQDNIQSLLDGKNIGSTSLPEIDENDIKIKNQNYSDLSEEERKAKIKQDSLEYITKVSYIMASNAPEIVTTTADVEKMATTAITETITAIENGDPKYLENLSEKGNRMLLELRDVEVPENMLESHKKAIQLFQYASSLPNELKSFDSDPLANIVVLSKMQGILSTISGFVTQISKDMKELGIDEIPVKLGV